MCKCFSSNARTSTMRDILIIGIAFILTHSCTGLYLTRDLPCHFLDSINITDGIAQTDGSIIFQNTIFPENQYAEVNYVLKNGNDHIPVKSHLRGCLCSIKPCMRLCCPPGTIVEYSDGKQVCKPHEAARKLTGEVVSENNKKQTLRLDQKFAFVDQHPCHQLYFADDPYQIKNTGEILHENTTLNHHEYCLAVELNEETNRIDVELMVCFESEESDIRFRILPYGMLLSVVFIIATLLIYCVVPKLRNAHGNCLVVYLVTLAITYSIVSFVQLNAGNYIEQTQCNFIAYFMYFTFLATYLWLNVVNFDLWLSFQSDHCMRRLSETKRFFVYTIYGYGLPFILTILAHIFDSTELLPEHFRPRFGVDSCFLKNEKKSKFLFYFLPLLIIFTLNIVLFILTAVEIRRSQSIRADGQTQQNKRFVNKKRIRFSLYLRLFMVMGILWTTEVLSLMAPPEHPVLLLSDICNTLHGVFIFIIFVMKRQVFRSIKQKWQCAPEKPVMDKSIISQDAANTFVPMINPDLNDKSSYNHR